MRNDSLAAERYREMINPAPVNVKDRRTALVMGRVNYLTCHVCGAREPIKEPETPTFYGWQYLRLIWDQVAEFKKLHKHSK